MTATKKPTPTIKGLAGFVLEKMPTGNSTCSQRWLAAETGLSINAVQTCLGKLKTAGLVVRERAWFWRRVEAPAAAPTIGVGDRVRIVGDERTRPELLDEEGTVQCLGERLATVRLDNAVPGCMPVIACRLTSLVRLPDADVTPFDPPRKVIAWAHRAGLPVKAGPPTPAETAIMGRGA